MNNLLNFAIPLRFGAAVVLAATLVSPAAAQIGVEVNGRSVQFGAVEPQRIGGRVLIPLRAVVEALGAEVKWNAATQTVSGRKGERDFSLSIGGRQATVNGNPVALDVPAQLISGNTMVPLRFVAEALGAEVEWNAGAQQVVINDGGKGRDPEPPVAEAGRIHGEVISVQPGRNGTITLRVDGVRQTYRVTRETIILRGEEGRRGTSVGLSQVQAGDTVDLRLGADRDTVEVVEAHPAPAPDRNPGNPGGGGQRDPNTLFGEVVSVRTRGTRATVVIQTRTGQERVDVPRNAEVTRGRDAEPASIADLKAGDRVRITHDGEGVATRVSIFTGRNAPEAPAAGRTLTGEVVAVRPGASPPTLTVQTTAGRRTLEINTNTDIFRSATRGGKGARVALREILTGDQVRIRTNADGTVAETIDAEPE